ncbi:MAG: hypothetical protein AAFY24_17815, partial [Pseudomonadota bacterium]
DTCGVSEEASGALAKGEPDPKSGMMTGAGETPGGQVTDPFIRFSQGRQEGDACAFKREIRQGFWPGNDWKRR